MHTAFNQKDRFASGLLSSANAKIPQTLQAQVSTFRRPGSATSSLTAFGCKLQIPHNNFA